MDPGHVAAEEILSFRAVDITYGRKQAVFGCSFSVPAGSCFGLIGLNGAGKTTLIKALLGLRETRSGEILIRGRPAGEASGRRILAYLPERFDPPWFLKGEEFIKFSMSLYGAPFDRQAMEDLAVRLQLDPSVLGSRMSTYSKGMRQKAGLMATIMTGCPLLVLDEPMSGLDPAARAAVKDVLGLIGAQGRTIFFSSHILSDMDEMCDRAAVIHKGRLVYKGTPSGLKADMGLDNLERAFLKSIEGTQAFAAA